MTEAKGRIQVEHASTQPKHIGHPDGLEAVFSTFGLPIENLLDCMADAVSMLDHEWRYVYVNSRAEVISGLTREQLIGRSIWDLFPAAVGSEVESTFRRAVAEQRPLTFEHYYPPFSRWYEHRVCPTSRGLLFVTTDIDDRKRLDRRMREGEERYRHLFELTDDGILIVDDHGRYVEVNGSYCRFLKTTRERLIGAHFAEFIPPERLEEAAAAFANLKSGKPTPVDFPLRAADGSIVELEWNSHPHYLPNLSFCICRNRTEARRVQAALQSAEERQRRAVEAGRVGLWEWDIEKNKVSWSDYIYELHGLPRGSFPGTAEAFADLIDEADKARVSEALQKALAGEADYRVEFRAARPDGKLQWLQTSGKVMFHEDGSPAIMHGAVIDTTERRHAEDMQGQIDQQLMLLVEASGALLASPHSSEVLHTIIEMAQRFVSADAHAVWNRDLNDRWSLSSSAGLSEQFMKKGLVSPQTSSATFLSAARIIEDVAQEPMLEQRRDALLSEGIHSMLVIPLRSHGDPTGTVVFYWKSLHKVRESEIRIASALGNLAASALGIANLYDEQLSLRGEAEAAEKRARFLSEAGALLSSSLDYDVTLARVAQLAIPDFADWASVELRADSGEMRRIAVVHRDPEKILFADNFAKRYPPREGDLSLVALRTGKSFLIEEVSDDLIVERARDEEHLRLIRELGLKSVIVAPMVIGERSLGLISFVTAESGRRYNSTDLQTAEELARRAATALDNARLYEESRKSQLQLQTTNEELRRVNEDLNQFAYTAAHDLQEPLRVIQAYSQLLKKKYGRQLGDTDANQCLDFIVRGAERLERLLRDIRTYTQTAHPTGEDPGMVEAAAVFRNACGNLESSINETGTEITSSELPRVKIQEVHLLQLFQNLIGNAIKYRGHERPRVEVGCVCEEKYWLFSIKDNGIGIDAEYRQQIFALFKRLHSAEEYEGTGVGLAICQKIVERYGGKIWVESAPEQGSIFRFTLPV